MFLTLGQFVGYLKFRNLSIIPDSRMFLKNYRFFSENQSYCHGTSAWDIASEFTIWEDFLGLFGACFGNANK